MPAHCARDMLQKKLRFQARLDPRVNSGLTLRAGEQNHKLQAETITLPELVVIVVYY